MEKDKIIIDPASGLRWLLNETKGGFKITPLSTTQMRKNLKKIFDKVK